MRTAGMVGTVLGIIVSVVQILCAAIGIVSFFNGSNAYISCGEILIVLGLINLFLAGQSPTTIIIAAVLGGIVVGDMWSGACIGICFEAAIVCTIDLFFRFIVNIGYNRSDKRYTHKTQHYDMNDMDDEL